jgi:hypothetical protein
MQKYKTDPLDATGLKASLWILISILFSLPSFSFSLTSLDLFLIVARTSMSSASSRRDPSAFARRSSNYSSKVLRILVLLVTSS